MKTEEPIKSQDDTFQVKTHSIDESSESFTQPEAVLPFKVDENQCKKCFKVWLESQWMAPSKLKENIPELGPFKGVYIPYFAFTTDAHVAYKGTRISGGGDDDSRDTVKGELDTILEHVLISAIKTETSILASDLGFWRFNECVSCEQEVFGEFTKKLASKTFLEAKMQGFEKMDSIIEELVKKKIGGERQNVDHKKIDYKNMTVQFLYLPVWMSSYSYKDNTYDIVADGSTGAVNGNYPYSKVKMAGFFLFIIVMILALVYFLLLLAGKEPPVLSW